MVPVKPAAASRRRGPPSVFSSDISPRAPILHFRRWRDLAGEKPAGIHGSTPVVFYTKADKWTLTKIRPGRTYIFSSSETISISFFGQMAAQLPQPLQ